MPHNIVTSYHTDPKYSGYATRGWMGCYTQIVFLLSVTSKQTNALVAQYIIILLYYYQSVLVDTNLLSFSLVLVLACSF